MPLFSTRYQVYLTWYRGRLSCCLFLTCSKRPTCCITVHVDVGYNFTYFRFHFKSCFCVHQRQGPEQLTYEVHGTEISASNSLGGKYFNDGMSRLFVTLIIQPLTDWLRKSHRWLSAVGNREESAATVMAILNRLK